MDKTMLKDAQAPVGQRSEGGFLRTSISMYESDEGKGCSFDLLDTKGNVIRINAFEYDDAMIIDVIDIHSLFKIRRALTFINGRRESIDAGQCVSVDFRNA